MQYFTKFYRYFFILFLSAWLPMQAYATTSIQEKFAKLESETGVKIGLSAVNTANNKLILYRATERFPIQSTVKLVGVAAVLQQSTINKNLLTEKISYQKQDVVEWSPITEKNIAKGMTISELCAATMMYSDNTAINLLVKKLGGLHVVNQFARSIGNKTFRFDHWEPEMNSNPNKIQDTSIPNDMRNSLQKILLGNVLTPSQRTLLQTWMKGNTVGDTRIRAGVPAGWVVADKTGAGSYGISNDIGVIWPPNGAPIVVAIYTVQSKKDAVRRDDVVAWVTHMVVEEFGGDQSIS